jgi:hypothetical protein
MADDLNRGLCYQKLNQEQQASFYQSPAPALTKFEVGDRVWKWTAPGGLLVNRERGTISEYWIPWKSMKIGSILVPGFKEFRMRHQNSDGSVARFRDAV